MRGNAMRFSSSSSSSSLSDEDEVVRQVHVLVDEDDDSATSVEGFNKKRLLSKQLSMRETSREAKWEKRRRQILSRQGRMKVTEGGGGEEEQEVGDDDEEEEERRRRGRVRSLTDEDLDELRGFIELGFGFDEENGGQNLCDTLPALDLYFAVNRQLSDPKLRASVSPVGTPSGASSMSNLGGIPSPRSPHEQEQQDSWKICNPGENPQHVKMKLRHWAQAVACSVRQCC